MLPGMVDIRLVRLPESRVWMWTGALALLALGGYASTFFLEDPTDPGEMQRVGAQADFGAERAPVLPARPIPFASVRPVTEQDLGALVRVAGIAETPVRANAVFVRAEDDRRVLVRFEPAPAQNSEPEIAGGGTVELEGYLQRIALAEYRTWVQDTLGHRIPRPRAHHKFGWVPDDDFRAIDSLYIKSYYLSVRPRAPDSATGAGEGDS